LKAALSIFGLGCLAAALAAPALAADAPAPDQGVFKDPLDTPALMRTRAAERPLLAVARAGKRLVAVGLRGMIITSEDEGKTWTQSKVPVQSDLLAVQFPTDTDGWAVGHDGVVLHTADAGVTWDKQIDGRIEEGVFKNFYAQPDVVDAKALGDIKTTIESNFRSGPSLPFLDVYFEDTQRGYAVGSYGMFMGTVDGGKTWEPWLHRIDNLQGLNLNAVHGIAGDVYIAGEQGLIYKLDRAKGYFKKSATGYAGSFFGVIGGPAGDSLLAYGLRGVVFRSTDRGATWKQLPNPSDSTITAGIFTADPPGFALATEVGEVFTTGMSATGYERVALDKPMPLTAILPLDRANLVIAGQEGVRRLPVTAASGAKRADTVSR
jgi:photosystem II stability/assembly factor-like uncharacterized protein